MSRDFSAYQGKLVAVRGIYYYGLRQTCPQTCATGPWPSFLFLIGPASAGPDGQPTPFATDESSWAAVDNAQRAAEREAKLGKRVEVWVTVLGELHTQARGSPCGALAKGYGHLGASPAELVVKSFSDIRVVANPNSTYDYGNMHHGAL